MHHSLRLSCPRLLRVCWWSVLPRLDLQVRERDVWLLQRERVEARLANPQGLAERWVCQAAGLAPE
jgi:hypothetical protein